MFSLFSQLDGKEIGPVSSVRRSKGNSFGFVVFKRPEDAQSAAAIGKGFRCHQLCDVGSLLLCKGSF